MLHKSPQIIRKKQKRGKIIFSFMVFFGGLWRGGGGNKGCGFIQEHIQFFNFILEHMVQQTDLQFLKVSNGDILFPRWFKFIRFIFSL